MKDPARFSVVIPVYNKWELTADCLRSLKEHTPEYPFEVIVADNASSDATATELEPLGKTLFGSRFTRLRFEENRNFGPACNAGAREASSPLLFFLNNDTLLTPHWAPPLMEALEKDPGLGGVGPLLLYTDNTVQHLGVAFSFSEVEHLYRGFPADHPVTRKRRKFQVITAAAFLLPKSLFMEYRGFYEEFRNGFEDVDLCLRIHADGKKFSCIPESVVYHLESQSPGRREGEKGNPALLQKRVGDMIRIDRHIYGLEDGFTVFINDLLEISLVMKEEDERILLQKADNQDIEGWLHLLQQNPCWLSGREQLARYLESQKLFHEALELRASAAGLLRSEQAYKQLIRCAIRVNDTARRKQGEKKLRRILHYKHDRQSTEAHIQMVLNHAERYGDSVLAELYLKKLAAMFPRA